MDTYVWFEIAAAGMSAVSCYLYLAGIWRGETKPNRVSYWIWFIMSSLMMLSFQKSGGSTFWLQLMYVVSPLLIAVHSLRFGEGAGLTRLDKGCLAIGGVSVPIWGVLVWQWGNTPEAALPIFFMHIFSDAMGAVPTLEKSWNRPHTENGLSWLVALLAVVLNLGAVRTWTAPDLIWNGWMTGIALACVLCVYRPVGRNVALQH